MKKAMTVVLCLLMCGCKGAKKEETAETVKEEVYACRILNTYDYNNPVPYSAPADDAYYEDSLFVGDSRMGSIALYGIHDNAQVEYVTSLNLMRIDQMTADDTDKTLMEFLRDTDKHNIYMLFGINEIRNPNFTAFGEKLESIVKELLEKDPYLNIYIILSYHPDDISGLPEPALSEHLLDLNTTQQDIAIRNHVFYLNPDEALDDENGTVIDEYVWDGLHFNVPGARAFEEYLGTHIVRRDDYVKEICE